MKWYSKQQAHERRCCLVAVLCIPFKVRKDGYMPPARSESVPQVVTNDFCYAHTDYCVVDHPRLQYLHGCSLHVAPGTPRLCDGSFVNYKFERMHFFLRVRFDDRRLDLSLQSLGPAGPAVCASIRESYICE